MATPPLPLFPSPQIPAQPGSPGGGIHYPAPGSLPYKPPMAADAMQGLGNFMQQLLQSKVQQKEYSKQKFLENLAMAQAGIPIDVKKTEQLGRKAGILDQLQTEVPEMPAQPQGQPGLTAPQGMPGGGQPMGQMNPQPQQMPQQPGFLGRMLQGLGLKQPQVVPNSAAGNWLQNLVTAGQSQGGMPGDVERQRALQTVQSRLGMATGAAGIGQAGVEENLAGLMQKAIQRGVNPQEMETLIRSGKMGQMPADQIVNMVRNLDPTLPETEVKSQAAQIQLASMLGLPQMRMSIMQMAEKGAAFFGNDFGKSMAYYMGIASGKPVPGLYPQYSPEQTKALLDAQASLMNSTGAPSNIVDLYAHSMQIPGNPMSNQLAEVMSKWPNRISSELTRTGMETASAEKRTGWEVGARYAEIGNQANIAANRLNFDAIQSLREGHEKQWDEWYKLASNPNTPPAAAQAAFQAMANTMSADKQITVKVNGKDVPLSPQEVTAMGSWSPFTGRYKFGETPYLSPLQNQGSTFLMQYLMGGQGNKSEAIRQFAAQAMGAPDGPQRLQALGSLMQALQTVPKAQRMEMIKSMNLPNDMKAAANEAANSDLSPIDLSQSPYLQK